MATAKFFLQQPYKPGQKDRTKKVLNDRETRIYLYLIIDRRHIIKLKTEWTIQPKEWDFRKQQRKDILAGSIEYNEKLEKRRKDALEQYEKLKEQFPDMPFVHIGARLKRHYKEIELPELKEGKTMQDVFDDYLENMKGEYSEGSIKKATTLKNVLFGTPDKPEQECFIKQYPKFDPLVFSMIDHKFYASFVKFLRNKKATKGRQKSRPEGEQDGLLEDTVGKYIESLRTFCSWAEKWGHNNYTTYKEFKLVSSASRKRKAKNKGGEIVTLTLPELRQFYNYDFSDNPRLDRVRDLLCFACFTGQRWGDIITVDKNDIIGDDIWKLTAKKTSHETEIDLIGFHAPALEILKKYDYQLPTISAQQFNNYSKEAGKEAGITTPVKIRRWVGSKVIEIEKPKYQFMSSHMGRRTCVSILLNDYSMSVSYVMGITGHQSVATLQKYINKDRDARRRAAEKQINAMEDVFQIEKNKAV